MPSPGVVSIGTAPLPRGPQEGKLNSMETINQETRRKLWGTFDRMRWKATAEGVPLHPGWLTFAGFWMDMEGGWAPGLALKRKVRAAGFVPGNCFWGPLGRVPDPERPSREKAAPGTRPRGRPPGTGHVWVQTEHGPMRWADARLLYSQYQVLRMPRVPRPEAAA